jgi:glycosyltransferase involved in cell wall biosynthesis
VLLRVSRDQHFNDPAPCAMAGAGCPNFIVVFTLLLCSLNTLLLLQLLAEFHQDPESSDIVEIASRHHERASDPPAISMTCAASASPLPQLPPSLANWTILWHAPFFSGGGYCSEAWSYFYLLQAMGADVRIVQHGDGVEPLFVSEMNGDQTRAAASSARAINRRIISVCHSEPGAWTAPSPRFSTSRCPHPMADIAIGRTMFETDRLPQGWPQRLLHMHRVWVPTLFHQRVFAQGAEHSLAERLRVLPQTVEEVGVGCLSPLDSRSLRRINADSRFKFLAVGKWERRKGWDVLLRAWCKAFPAVGSGDQAQEVLLVRTASYHSSSDFESLIDAELKSDKGGTGRAACAPIELLPTMSADEMKHLYRSVQALVSTSHGEGWGRPLAEAAAAGCPVISPDWSGPTAFLTNATATLIPVRSLQLVGEGAFADHMWASIDVDDARDALLSVRHNLRQAKEKAAAAQADMSGRFGAAAVGRELAMLLDEAVQSKWQQ